MIYVVLTILGTLALVFLNPLHNEVGAVIMGMDAAGIDFCLQWLRFKVSKDMHDIKYLALTVFGGLAVRAAILFIFLKISIWRFGFNSFNFYLFAICLLVMVPVLSLVAANLFKPQRD